MARKTIYEMYKDLFGVKTDAYAIKEVNKHLNYFKDAYKYAYTSKKFDDKKRDAFGFTKADDEFFFKCNNLGAKEINKVLKNNYYKNIYGDGEIKNSLEAAMEFIDYIKEINSSLAKEGYDVNKLIRTGNMIQSIVGESDDYEKMYSSWLLDWKEDFLTDVSTSRLDVRYEYLFGKNPITGKKPEISEGMAKALEDSQKISSEVSSLRETKEKHEDFNFKDVLTSNYKQMYFNLKASIEKHESHWWIWKFFNGSKFQAEQQAINSMKELINNTFTPAEIKEINDNYPNLDNEEVLWLKEEKENNMLLSRDSSKSETKNIDIKSSKVNLDLSKTEIDNYVKTWTEEKINNKETYVNYLSEEEKRVMATEELENQYDKDNKITYQDLIEDTLDGEIETKEKLDMPFEDETSEIETSEFEDKNIIDDESELDFKL